MRLRENNETIIAAVSELKDGNMRVGSIPPLLGGPDSLALQNRALYFSEILGINPLEVVSAGLIHRGRVEVVGHPHSEKPIFIPEVDSLITGEKGVYLSITAADCPPLFLFDPIKEVIALIHCGWKPLASKVIENTFKVLGEQFGVDNRSDLIAWIGPGICRTCYEVGPEVWQKFYSPHITDEPTQKMNISLSAIITQKLLHAHVESVNIFEIFNECSFHQEYRDVGSAEEKKFKYFSFRRQKSNPLQTQMAVLGMKK